MCERGCGKFPNIESLQKTLNQCDLTEKNHIQYRKNYKENYKNYLTKSGKYCIIYM